MQFQSVRLKKMRVDVVHSPLKLAQNRTRPKTKQATTKKNNKNLTKKTKMRKIRSSLPQSQPVLPDLTAHSGHEYGHRNMDTNMTEGWRGAFHKGV